MINPSELITDPLKETALTLDQTIDQNVEKYGYQLGDCFDQKDVAEIFTITAGTSVRRVAVKESMERRYIKRNGADNMCLVIRDVVRVAKVRGNSFPDKSFTVIPYNKTVNGSVGEGGSQIATISKEKIEEIINSMKEAMVEANKEELQTLTTSVNSLVNQIQTLQTKELPPPNVTIKQSKVPLYVLSGVVGLALTLGSYVWMTQHNNLITTINHNKTKEEEARVISEGKLEILADKTDQLAKTNAEVIKQNETLKSAQSLIESTSNENKDLREKILSLEKEAEESRWISEEENLD